MGDHQLSRSFPRSAFTDKERSAYTDKERSAYTDKERSAYTDKEYLRTANASLMSPQVAIDLRSGDPTLGYRAKIFENQRIGLSLPATNSIYNSAWLGARQLR